MVLKSEAAAGAWTIDKISNLRAEKNKKNCKLGFELPVKMEQDRNGCEQYTTRQKSSPVIGCHHA